MDRLSVAVVQFNPTDDVGSNLANVASHARRAAAEGASLIVFPEYSSWFSPRLGQETVDNAEDIDGSFVTGLRKIAQDLGVYMVCGFIERISDSADRCSNTIVALNPSGEIIAHYNKIHLYDAFGQVESEWVQPGKIQNAPVFSLGSFTVGIQTCYDLRFPEITRWLMDAGADLILVPAEWVAGEYKLQHWQTLLAARAIENTVYIAAADHTPPVAVGNSCIIDPRGQQLASVQHEVDIAHAEISLETLREVRRINPALQLRRFAVHPLASDEASTTKTATAET